MARKLKPAGKLALFVLGGALSLAAFKGIQAKVPVAPAGKPATRIGQIAKPSTTPTTVPIATPSTTPAPAILEEQLNPRIIIDSLDADSKRKDAIRRIVAQESGFDAFATGKDWKNGDAGVAQLTPNWLAFHRVRTGTVVNPFDARQSIEELNKHLDFSERFIREQLARIPALQRKLSQWDYSAAAIRLAAVGAHKHGLPVKRFRKGDGTPGFLFDPERVRELAQSDYVRLVLGRGKEMKKGLFVSVEVHPGVIERRIKRAIEFLRASKHGFHAGYRGRWIAALQKQLEEVRGPGKYYLYAPRFQLQEEVRSFGHARLRRETLAKR